MSSGREYVDHVFFAAASRSPCAHLAVTSVLSLNSDHMTIAVTEWSVTLLWAIIQRGFPSFPSLNSHRFLSFFFHPFWTHHIFLTVTLMTLQRIFSQRLPVAAQLQSALARSSHALALAGNKVHLGAQMLFCQCHSHLNINQLLLFPLGLHFWRRVPASNPSRRQSLCV